MSVNCQSKAEVHLVVDVTFNATFNAAVLALNAERKSAVVCLTTVKTHKTLSCTHRFAIITTLQPI